MAYPRDLIDGMHLYTESDRINNVMIALYGASPENLFEGDLVRDDLPRIEDIELVCNDLLGTDEDGNLDEEISIHDIHGLIVNLVLYDALLDDSLYGQEFPDTYQPRRLLELIQYDDLHSVVIDGHHIFHWASERLFPYFLDKLGEEFVRSEFDESVGPHGNTYLHSYLENLFRVLNPTFVTYLLDIGFSLSTQNNNGDTPLHLIVYESRAYEDSESEDPFYTRSKEDRQAMRNGFVREGNALELRRYHNRMKRYNRYYQTLIILFRHGIHIDGEGNIDHPDLRIENDQGITVDEIIYGADHSYPVEDLREAHEVAMGRPSAVERGRKQKLTEALRRLPRNITNRIRNSQGANLERARAVIKQHQMNNTRRKKEMVHRQLLSRKPINNRSGGRRTYRGDTSFPHTPLHSRRKQRAKKTRR
jgi:hypothetical protein